MNPTTPTPPVKDEEIINLYFARDERAIRETDGRYGRTCMNLSMEILRSRPDAEECVSDTYLRAWNAIPPTRPQSLCAFLLRIVRNLSISRLREMTAGRRTKGATVPLSELESCLAAREYSDHELADALRAFIDSLDEKTARLFVGRYWYNLSVRELAAEWEMRPNTVSQILFRTREKLRIHLEKGGHTI